MEGIGELAITRGRPTCPERCELHAEWLWIDVADPRILVTRRLLAELLLLGTGPHADLQPGPGAVSWEDFEVCPGVPDVGRLDELSGQMTGWLLTIRAANRTVLYRITGKSPLIDGYEAEWPD